MPQTDQISDHFGLMSSQLQICSSHLLKFPFRHHLISLYLSIYFHALVFFCGIIEFNNLNKKQTSEVRGDNDWKNHTQSARKVTSSKAEGEGDSHYSLQALDQKDHSVYAYKLILIK